MSEVTVFDGLRYGYFEMAFGNILKSIRGGTNPLGTTTLAMCCVGALSSVEWALANMPAIEETGVVTNDRRTRESAGYIDSLMFKGFLDRWIRETGINADCDAERVYGLRCALVHTGGGAEALCKTGVWSWMITADERWRDRHYKVIQECMYLDMPDFIAEILLAFDKFSLANRDALNSAPTKVLKRISGIAKRTVTDEEGFASGHEVDKQCLDWFDKKFSESPLQIEKSAISEKIRNFYWSQVNAGLVIPS